MSIDILRETFVEQAATVEDIRLATRAGAARRQATRIRRRRAAVAVAVVALAVPAAGAAFLSVNPMDNAGTVVQPPEPTGNDDLLRDSFAGRTMIESRTVTDQTDLELTLPASRGTEWRPVCRNAGPAYVLHMTLDEGSPRQIPCDVELTSGERAYYTLGDDYPVTGQHTLHLWLTKSGEAEHSAPPGAVLAAGVYRLPDPVAVVANHQVFELDEDNGAVWKVVRSEESENGERTLASTQSAEDGRISVDWYTSGSAPREVQVYIDGRLETSLALNDGGPGLALAPGSDHTVELRIIGPVPADALLGIVWRSEVP